MGLATKSLLTTSIEAARLWRDLQRAKDTDEIDKIIEFLWQTQNNQELTVDICADFNDQINAEIIAVKARLEHLVTIHKNAIKKLETWQEKLNKSIIQLNEQGFINNETFGKQRRIIIKDNPPTCEILVEPEELPEEYQRVVKKITADKKAITNAWRQGIPVEGTEVYRKRKVVYELIKSNNFEEFQANTQNKTSHSQNKKRKQRKIS